jgi:hypothetical protein
MCAVSDKVKALSKKRKHQIIRNLSFSISRGSMVKYQVLWYVSFIAVYIWFLYWVAYDFFVWHKPIAEVNAVNYVGSIVSIALIWAGTKIWTRNRVKAVTAQQELPPPQKPQPHKLQRTKPQQTAPPNSMCTHHLGYLHERRGSWEIPAECLTCEHLIQCMGSRS